jgi:hypothetical protein
VLAAPEYKTFEKNSIFPPSLRDLNRICDGHGTFRGVPSIA